MNDKTLEAMLEYALANGLDDLEIRLDLSLVMGDKRLKIMAVEGDPQMVAAGLKGFTDNWDTMRAELQQALDQHNKAETTIAKA